jgi:vacuolar-type H+-ATPase subunit E/Vma4
MGHEELAASLRREGDESIRLLWQEAENEAGRLRARTVEARVEMRRKTLQTAAGEASAKRRSLLAGAEHETRFLRVRAEAVLLEKLSQAARSSLGELRGEEYEAVFRRLCGELPPARWEKVRVNPADRALAGEIFPGTTVEEDTAISGGVDAMGDEEGIRVVNTFEKRLEKVWDQLVPDLVRDLREYVGGDS